MPRLSRSTRDQRHRRTLRELLGHRGFQVELAWTECVHAETASEEAYMTTSNSKSTEIKNTCLTCGTEFLWSTRRKFCSHDCRGEHASPPPSLEEIERKGREIRLARGLGVWTDSLD